MIFLGLSAGTAAAAAGDAVTYWNNVVVSATITGITPPRPNPETAIAAAYMHRDLRCVIASIDGRYTPFARRSERAAGAERRVCRSGGAKFRSHPAATFRQSPPQSARHAIPL
jgi:hypothetical protein